MPTSCISVWVSPLPFFYISILKVITASVYYVSAEKRKADEAVTLIFLLAFFQFFCFLALVALISYFLLICNIHVMPLGQLVSSVRDDCIDYWFSVCSQNICLFNFVRKGEGNPTFDLDQQSCGPRSARIIIPGRTKWWWSLPVMFHRHILLPWIIAKPHASPLFIAPKGTTP